jgi:hypothetical protein
VANTSRWTARLTLLVILAECVARPTYAQSLCASCEVQVGLGGTYHYWASTGSLVLPVSVTWSDNRYEFGVFRFTSQQLLKVSGTHERCMADPYWGASVSRRWQLFSRGPLRVYFGFGLALKTESDVLSVTRWDFASQLGLRFRLPGNRLMGEITMRHWSNAGIQLPNHGQDFATLTFWLNSALFGKPQYSNDFRFSLNRSLVANGSGAEPLLP